MLRATCCVVDYISHCFELRLVTITKDFNVSLNKSYENCRLDKIDKFIKNKKFYISKNSSTSHKRVYEISDAKYLSRIKCFKCYEKTLQNEVF